MGCNPTKELHEDIKPALHSPAFVAHEHEHLDTDRYCGFIVVPGFDVLLRIVD
jgi:hypothetical protein